MNAPAIRSPSANEHRLSMATSASPGARRPHPPPRDVPGLCATRSTACDGMPQSVGADTAARASVQSAERPCVRSARGAAEAGAAAPRTRSGAPGACTPHRACAPCDSRHRRLAPPRSSCSFLLHPCMPPELSAARQCQAWHTGTCIRQFYFCFFSFAPTQDVCPPPSSTGSPSAPGDGTRGQHCA